MFKCPHCEEKGIHPVRKAILSPGIPATCKSCEAESTLRYKSWLTAMIPGSLLMLTAFFVNSEQLETLLDYSGLALMIILPFIFTPLHKYQQS
jgi:Mn2+/Fe2+ NRAMP family transporter